METTRSRAGFFWPEFRGDEMERVRFLKRREVLERIGGPTTSTLYLWMARGLFPRQVKLGPSRVGWRESDVDSWSADPQGWAEKNRGAA